MIGMKTSIHFPLHRTNAPKIRHRKLIFASQLFCASFRNLGHLTENSNVSVG